MTRKEREALEDSLAEAVVRRGYEATERQPVPITRAGAKLLQQGFRDGHHSPELVRQVKEDLLNRAADDFLLARAML